MSDDHEPIPCRHVVAMPYPGHGSINPALSLCAAVAGRSPDVRVTVVLTEEWLGLVAAKSNVSFAAIPNVVPPERARGDDLRAFVAAVLTNMRAPFERLLDGGSLQPPPDFIIGDAFVSWIHEAAAERNIPSAHMWTMSPTVYSVFYHFDLLAQQGHYPVDLSVNGDAVVDYIPGVPPVRVADLPLVIRDQESMSKLIQILPKESNAKYLIFTSFYELEAQAIDAIKQKSSMSIYTVGPADVYSKLRDIKTTPVEADDTNDYLRWLDHQPPSSVLYISLGSFLNISTAQMDEIAAGLQESGVRFLWVARREAARLQRMFGDEGKIVEWCDQVRVLGHPSVGGFLSHCGWNSTQEALLAGVPVLTFPIMMDQSSDAKAIVEDWRVGWRFLEREFDERKGGWKFIEREFDERNLKKRDEVAGIVKRFMDLESGERKELSRNAREMQKICERQFDDGGPHQTNLDHFITSIKS